MDTSQQDTTFNSLSNKYITESPAFKGQMDRSGVFSGLLDISGQHDVDMSQMRIQMKQLKLDLQSEQDLTNQLRRRLNTAEKERLEAASRFNNEVTTLEGQLARVGSQIEKGEATRHSLEFELTKARRELSQQKQTRMEREAVLMETNDDLKRKIGEVSEEMLALQKQVQAVHQSSEGTEMKMRKELEEKEFLLNRHKNDQEVMRTEREKLEALLRQHQGTVSGLHEQIQELESERTSLSDHLRKALSEVDYGKEREEKMKKDIDVAVHRIKSLEENIEAERAAHLETKFNSEIVQLRVRDLEGGMDVEKSANIEATKAVERLAKQIREIEQAYNDERKVKKEAVHKMEKLEKEYTSVRRRLTTDVENKTNMIGQLSQELEVHQRNFNELKEELGKAKKRQVYLEDTYGGCMKELDMLISTFSPPPTDKTKKTTRVRKDEGKAKKLPSPSALLETLRRLLHDSKTKLDTTCEELSKCKKTGDKLSKEVDTYRDMVQAKDKALEDAQKNYTRTAKELSRVRAESSELEGILTRTKIDLHSTNSNQDKDRTRIQGLSEEIMKLVKRHRAEDEVCEGEGEFMALPPSWTPPLQQEKLAFLHGLYQRLLAGRIVVPAREKGFNQLSWTELTEAVYQQVVAMINSLQQADEKMRGMEEAVAARDEKISTMQQSYEDQLDKLTSLTKEQESSWQRQKEELQQHYTQLIGDLQSRSKKSQAVADQAWEKIRATGSVQQGLESECSELRRYLDDADTQISSLSSACALLAGALYPLYARANELASERRVLEDQMIGWDTCRERAQYLVSVLNSELNAETDKPERDRRKKEKRTPILCFRTGVIAVMAANRLCHLGRGSCKMFVTYDTLSGSNGLLVCTGGVRQSRRVFRGVGLPAAEEDEGDEGEVTRPGESHLLNWMTGNAITDLVVPAMSDFLEVAGQVKEKGGAVETRALIGAARSSFSKLLDKLGVQFPGISLQPMSALRERTSLVRGLGRCLSRTLSGLPVAKKQTLASSQDLMIALQHHIVDFTQRLHRVEVERRQLLAEVDQLKRQVVSEVGEVATTLDKMADAKEHNPKYVTMEKFERVCQELNSALRREQQAQHLLQEQSQQLEELSVRLDLCATQGMDKEVTLTEAVQGLSEAKVELRRREQSIRQLQKQVLQMEMERKSVTGNMADTENALHTANRDKDILSHYMKSVEGALHEAKRQMSLLKDPGRHDAELSKALLNVDFIPTDVGKAGPELIACQNLVGAFIDTQHQAVAKIHSLEDEIESHRRHVASLKQELSNAVRREYSHQQDSSPPPDEFEIIPSVSDPDVSSSRERFVPLREDSEVSYSVGRPSPIKSGPGSAHKQGRSPGFHTPQKLPKSSRDRPRTQSSNAR
ncbi:coiled-coil domain-containing protein 171-like isoform X3 [Haliotis rufescens]|uniref:coiled-coil domain-containing protein 171-like isoform X3 n=1 Tax=Haliotis rufescens TaxID=6454 RepID=UPI00201EF5E6|nr:coiled-coil domain-containing protein 171-like isoform X3 [Haliotis rufescens]